MSLSSISFEDDTRFPAVSLPNENTIAELLPDDCLLPPAFSFLRLPQNRRIRHLTGLAVRNLTPFPKRDGVASTLSEASAASSKGIQQAYIPDDADLVLSQRRTRKISAASISTLRSLRAQDDLGIAASSFSGGITIAEDITPTPTRKRRTSKARPALVLPPSTSGQQARRPRSSSQASLLNHLPQPSSPSSLRSPPFDISLFGSLAHHQHSTASSSTSGSTLQRSLEKVLQVRLVETLFTLSPSEEGQGGQPEAAAPPVKSSTASSAPRSRSPPLVSQRQRGHVKTATSISRSGHLQSPSSSSFSSNSRRSSSPATSRPTTPTPPPTPPISPSPFYVSTYHRPSTNPTWVGLDPEHEFSPSANSQSQRVLVTLWARVADKASREAWRKSSPPDISGKGKAKEEGPYEDSSWQPVQQWDIDLTDAEPLPEEVRSLHNSTMASSTELTQSSFLVPDTSAPFTPQFSCYCSWPAKQVVLASSVPCFKTFFSSRWPYIRWRRPTTSYWEWSETKLTHSRYVRETHTTESKGQ